jgi:hypothetical protein
LPSTEQSIKYRPFLVKEEKLLVIALESEDTKQITNAIKTVIKNCILTKDIKVENLPTFDIEFCFLIFVVNLLENKLTLILFVQMIMKLMSL